MLGGVGVELGCLALFHFHSPGEVLKKTRWMRSGGGSFLQGEKRKEFLHKESKEGKMLT